MGLIGMLAAATVLFWATLAGVPCFAAEGGGQKGASSDASDRLRPVPDLKIDDGFVRRMVLGNTPPAREAIVLFRDDARTGNGATGRLAAFSLDRRVPAAQVTDLEGVSVIGVVGVVGELRHAFSHKERAPRPNDGGVARVVRVLRDSVFGKRISILSESGRIVENEPYLVGLSFTH